MNSAKFRSSTNIDLFVIAKELSQLKGSRLKKIYQYARNEFRLRFSSKEGTVDVSILLPLSIHITEQKREPIEPPAFVMLLRKHLENRILRGVEQKNLDRIIFFEFDDKSLILEFFGKGNLILVDKEGKIIAPMRGEITKTRRVKRGEKYILPEMKKIQPSEVSLEKIKGKEEKEEKNILASLSNKINLPPFYIEEILFRAGVDPKINISQCTDENFSSIIEEIKKFQTELDVPAPILYEDGKYSVIKLSGIESKGIKGKTFAVFSSLLDTIYSGYLKEEKEVVKEKPKIEMLEKIERKLKHQQEHLKQLEREAEESQAIGKKIVDQADIITALTEVFSRLKGEGKTWKEIEKELSKIHPVKIEKGKIVLEL